MIESDFQSKFIKKLKEIFIGCIVLKNDARYMQGVPDWIVIYGNKYAMLEMKRSKHERRQPNQNYYVTYFNSIGSYSAFVFPENEQQILEELSLYFKGETHDLESAQRLRR